MMIKKQLGVLAGAVLAASSASAAFNAGSTSQAGGTDSSVVVLLTDFGGTGTYALDVQGTSQDDLLAGTGFTFTLSAAAQAWAGAASDLRYAVVATSAQAGTYVTYIADNDAGSQPGCTGSYCYAYDNVNPESLGLIYASTAPSGVFGVSDNAVFNARDVNGFLGNLAAFNGDNESVNAEGTAGDGDANPATNAIVNGLFENASAVSNIYFLQANPGNGGALDSSNFQPVGASQLQDTQIGALTASFDGANFTVAAVPVPAAAWLFGSALLGLGVVRRK